jgi:hypothetical protein
MTRTTQLLAASFVLAVAVVASPARANDMFGNTGDVWIGGIASYSHSNASAPYGGMTTVTAMPHVDVTVAPGWFVGFAPIFSYSMFEIPMTQSDGTTITSSTSTTTYGAGVRLGEIVPVTDRFALRPVLDFAVTESKAQATGVADDSAHRASAGLRLEATYALTDHVFITTSLGLVTVTVGSASSGIGVLGGNPPTPGYSAGLGSFGLGLEGRF